MPERTHDFFYINEDQLQAPKEYFKQASRILNLVRQESNTVSSEHLDIGCAAGDFLSYIGSLGVVPSSQLYGIDIMDLLVEESKKRLPCGNFCVSDISSMDFHNPFGDLQFATISMMGVHSIFDDFRWLSNVKKLLRPNGVFIVYGIFNPYDYDVLVRVSEASKNNYQSGWNSLSRSSFIQHAKAEGLESKVVEFMPDIDISEREDKLRSWSFDLNICEKSRYSSHNHGNPKRLFTNATRLIHDYAFIVVRNAN